MDERTFSVTDAWERDWDEPAICEWARSLRLRLGDQPVTFGLLFVTPSFFGHVSELLEILRVHAHIPVLAGCSTNGLVVGGREIEEGRGFVLGLYSLPGARAATFPVREEGDFRALAEATGIDLSGTSAWLAFVEPFQTDVEAWLSQWQDEFPGMPVYGGLAGGRGTDSFAQVYCNGEVVEEGGVVIAVEGVRCLGTVAQGCNPVGDTWTITQVERNIIRKIGNRPAVEVLTETFDSLDAEARERSRGNVFIGLVMDEYRDEYRRGDFLIRNIVGADPQSGAILVGALPRVGQTLQFQLRDAEAARKDLREMVGRLREEVGHSRVYGGCLCLCAGRGQALFGRPDHDSGLVAEAFGPSGIIGFFGNGEFGPVGDRSYVHGYTASLLLFVGPERKEEDEL